MENFQTKKFNYDDNVDIVDVQGGETASFTADEFTVTGGRIETTTNSQMSNNFGPENPIAKKIEQTFSAEMKHKNNRNYIDKINRYVKSMFGKNAKTNGNIRERGNPLK